MAGNQKNIQKDAQKKEGGFSDSPKRKINPTLKQKKAFIKIVENRGNISKAIREVGYNENTIKNPTNLTESLGFQKLCDTLGLTDEFLVNALVEDIEKKPQNRKPELELGFKIKRKISDRPNDEFPQGQSVHFHFHKDEKVLNIISEAEKKLSEQLKEEI